jgi:hypothetical protein
MGTHGGISADGKKIIIEEASRARVTLTSPIVSVVAVQPSVADDRAKILGIWRLVFYEVGTQATGEREPVLGKAPTGYTLFLPGGAWRW